MYHMSLHHSCYHMICDMYMIGNEINMYFMYITLGNVPYNMVNISYNI